MKKLLILFFITGILAHAQTNERTISGLTTDGRTSVANVTVTNKNSSSETISNDSGRYSIKANTGDIISYAYQGLKTVNIKVEDVTRILNVTMVPDIEELQEVTVTGSNRKSQRELELEYPSNENLIKTAYGYLNAETAPGKIRFMTEREINPVSLCILDLLRNQYSGVRVQGSCLGAFGPGAGTTGQVVNIEAMNTNEPGVLALSNANGGVQSSLNSGKVFIRGTNSVFNQRSAIFDVDGQIFNDAPIWLDVKNIKRLAILNNFATSTMYGSAGAGGVIVINTITGSLSSNEIYDRARLRNNYVSGKILTQQEVLNNGPTYLKELYASPDFPAAEMTYESYKKRYGNWPYFFIDAQRYFEERWGETEYADNIIDSHFGQLENNPVLLKAVAYNYEAQEQFEKANDFYKKVLVLRSDYGQSYMDMANSFRNLNKAKEAADIYNRYYFLKSEGLLENDSTSSFATLINREYNNLLMLKKSRLVEPKKARSLFVEEEDFKGTRVVFEWNDSEAEFDLQFVNPKDQYVLWKHSLADNSGLIADEKNLGYNSKEYLIDDSLPGVWKVNITYHGNKSLTPTYLKATVYHDYGTFSQRKEVRVFKLALKGVNQELFAIQKTSKVASR